MLTKAGQTRTPARAPATLYQVTPKETRNLRWISTAGGGVVGPPSTPPTTTRPRVRRVLAVIRDASGSLRALDLTKEGIGEKIAAATNKDLMESLFASEAMAY